jgi:hypothetical protein
MVHELDRADQRPAASFTMGERTVEGISRPAIVAPVPSRLTFPLPLPRRGVFHAFVALAGQPAGTPVSAVRLRVGVSDHRIYEGVSELTLPADTRGWIDLRADLSAYAGWKWSLFYRPDSITWRVVLAADATGSPGGTVLWASPEIITDTRSAREYARRRQRLR